MTGQWVCLVYHDVLPHRPRLNGSPEFFGVSHRTFVDQLDIIRDSGMVGCSLAEALERGGRGCVAISFDDGDAGQYARAFPTLLERKMTATFFIATSWVGRPDYVTWDQLREMKQAGMSIQSHTRTHAYMSELDPQAAGEEFRGSKEDLDTALEQNTDQIALPGGFEPPRVLWPLLLGAGYRVVANSRWGLNPALANGTSSPVRIQRCWAHGEPSREHFRRILAGDRRLVARYWARRTALEPLKSALGASRYLRWRQQVLDFVGKREH
jgi:peptidoglycan/xylan/chitin deacetylase (PgdA/CDA1 family)